jgi:hypothetical protein
MATTTSTKRSKKAKHQHSPPHPHETGLWSKAAPGRLRKLDPATDNSETWGLWQRHLAKRKLIPLAQRLGEKQPALGAIAATSEQLSSAEQIARLLRHVCEDDRGSVELEGAVYAWLSRAEVAPADVTFAAECLLWAEVLPELAQALSARAWWQLLERLTSVATGDTPSSDTLATVLLYAELPATLAYSFPELAATASLADTARHTLAEWSDQGLAESGAIHGQRLGTLMPLIASLARVRTLGKTSARKLWTSDAQKHFELLVEFAWRLARIDGSMMFSRIDRKHHRRALRSALRACKREKTASLAQAVEKGDKAGAAGLPASSWQLEDAGLAGLRCDWRRRSPQLAINHSSAEFTSELSLGKFDLWNGTHTLEIRFDGELLTPEGSWDQVCWESDRDIDYLELELSFSGGLTVQRHLALARNDQVLFWADAVLGAKPGKIEYAASFPLADRVKFVPEAETREARLSIADELVLRVAPLALNEWRNGPGFPGSLEVRDGRLVLTQAGSGQNLLVPLFLDLDPRRTKREITWRQLTVGKERKPVPHDVAVGYRVQVGGDQWLFYRAMGGAATRTVLGKNLYNELLIGRFHADDGHVTTLVEIEA